MEAFKHSPQAADQAVNGHDDQTDDDENNSNCSDDGNDDDNSEAESENGSDDEMETGESSQGWAGKPKKPKKSGFMFN